MIIKFAKRFRLAVLAAGFAVVGSAIATNGMVPHGFGTKNKGLAGAGVALPQDAMSVATNPAGAVWVGNSWVVGAGLFSPRREATEYNPNNTPLTVGFVAPGTYESDSNYFFVPFGARNWMLNNISAFTLAVYGAGGMNTDYNAGVWGNSTQTSTGIDLKQLFIAPTYSRKINNTTSVGVSAVIGVQGFKARGLGVFTNFSTDGANMTDKGTDIAYGIGLKLGIQSEVAPGLTLGASYATKVNMSEFEDYRGLFAENGDLDYPAIFTIGLAWKVTPRSVLVFDVQRIYYSDVKSIGAPVNSITACPALGLGGTDQNSCFGGSNGPGFGWDDMTVYKLGYQWETSHGWTWRVGYSHGNNPVKQTTLSILAPGVIEDHFTFGFTKKMSNTSEVNFAAMYAPESSIRRTSAIGFPDDVELKMYQFELELSYSKRF